MAAGCGELAFDRQALVGIEVVIDGAATGGNRTRAARLLGISERTLRNKLNSPRAASGS
jgi:DNA-binding NtrC family response regulator